MKFLQKIAVLHKFAKIDMHRSISVMVGKMSKIDSYQHRGSELRNTAQKMEDILIKAAQEQSFPANLDEDTKKELRQLLNSSSHYQKGLSETLLGDPEAADREFSIAIDQQVPFLSKLYLQRGNERLLSGKYWDALNLTSRKFRRTSLAPEVFASVFLSFQ